MGADGEEVRDLDHHAYIKEMYSEEFYAFVIAREFKLNPLNIIETWAYEDIYKTMSFLRYMSELEDKEIKKASKKRK